MAATELAGEKCSMYITISSRIFICRNEFMQCIDGAVVNLTSTVGTAGSLSLIMSSHWLEHPVSSHISSSLDVKIHYFSFIFLRQVGIEIKDFGQSWRSGVAFHSVIHAIRPDLVDMDKVKGRSNRENLEEAFMLAETELGIPRLLDPEGT